MKDQFVPYELAVKLKELGFDEECFGYSYRDTPDPKSSLNIYFAKQPINNSSLKEDKGIALPLWQQAFDFLLKKYYLYSVIIPTISMCWTFKTTTVVDGEIEVPPYKNVDATDYSTYEEAREACLEKLIQILEETK